VTLLLEYLGECDCFIRVPRSRIFIGGSLLFIAHQFFILFFHLVRAIYDAHSTFTAIFNSLLQAICEILPETLDFLIMQNRSCDFTKVGLSFIPLLSFTQLISNHQKALFWCKPCYIPIFSLFFKAVYPACSTEVRLCFLCKIGCNSSNSDQIYPKFDTGICL